MKTWILIPPLVVAVAVLLLCHGCGEHVRPVDPYKINKSDGLKAMQVENPAEPQVAVKRFSVESHGYFYGGYNNNPREIVIVTDAQTGRQYLCVTGCGATELHTEKSGKTTVLKEE